MSPISSALLWASSFKRSAFIFAVFWLPQLLSAFASGSHFPLSVGRGLIDNFICSWREGGVRGWVHDWSSLYLDEGTRRWFFSVPLLLFVPSRTHLKASSRTSCFFKRDKPSLFLKSVRSVVRKVSWEAFVAFYVYGGNLQFFFVQMGPIVLNTAGRFLAYLGPDGRLLYQLWVMSGGLLRFSFHSSRSDNMRRCDSLLVTDLIYIHKYFQTFCCQGNSIIG